MQLAEGAVGPEAQGAPAEPDGDGGTSPTGDGAPCEGREVKVARGPGEPPDEERKRHERTRTPC
eukprot:15430298-Alexandrium_andersonii.AAC.1